MIPLYTLLLTALSSVRWALSRKAARTERKYVKAAHEAEAVARQYHTKPGNASAADPYTTAKRQYELGRLVEVRDKWEAKYLTWQARTEKAGRTLTKLRGIKGRFVPYLLGVVDVGLVLSALHYLGLPHGLTTQTIQEWARSFSG